MWILFVIVIVIIGLQIYVNTVLANVIAKYQESNPDSMNSIQKDNMNLWERTQWARKNLNLLPHELKEPARKALYTETVILMLFITVGVLYFYR